MTPEQFARAQVVFDQACEMAEAERHAFVQAHCGDDPALLAILTRMLGAHAAPASSLDLGPGSEQIHAAIRALAISDAETPEVLPERIGGYRIIRLIASGGMGVVYEAEQDAPRRRVALKVMRLGISSRAAQRRFEYESALMARLQHPAIAQVFEAGWTVDASGQRHPFFAMEFVEGGGTLTDPALMTGLSTRDRLALFVSVCEAVHHGHQRGIIHRDLKPSNILLTTAPERAVKIIDFGVARFAADGENSATLRTEVGQVIGTVQYMSPEQVGGASADLDARSDVYSLGVVLYEFLTGALPYDVRGTSIAGAARVIADFQPPSMSSVDRSLRGDLETIVAKALAKDRATRYQSASELAADIRRFLADEPIHARPPTLVYSLRKAAARNKPAAVGLVAALLAVLLGAAASVWWAIAAGRARDASERQGYRLALNAAAAAIRDGLAGEATRDLESAPVALRGWEWRHLRSESDQSDGRFNVTTLLVADARFAGEQAVAFLTTYGADRRLTVIDLSTGRTTREVAVEGVRRAELSADGLEIAFLTRDGFLVRQETLTGREVARREVGRAVVTAHLGSGAMAGTVLVRSAETIRLMGPGQPISIPGVVDDDNWATEVASPDLRSLIRLSGATRPVDKLDPSNPNGNFRTTMMPGRANDTAAAFSPDSSRLVIVGRDGRVRMFDAQTLQPTGFGELEARSSQLQSVDWSSDGRLIAVGASNGSVRLYDPQGRAVRTLLGHSGGVASVRFNASGTRLVTSSFDGTVRVWSLLGRSASGTIGQHAGKVMALRASPAGGEVVSFGDEGLLKVWDVSGHGLLREVDTMLPSASVCAIVGLSLTADGQRIFTASSYPAATGPTRFPFRMGLYERTTLKPVGYFDAQRESDRFGCGSISPDGRLAIATAPGDQQPEVRGMELMHLDGQTLGERTVVPLGMPAENYPQGSKVVFSADSSLAIAPGPENRLLVIDTTSWQVIKQLLVPGGPRIPVWWRSSEPGSQARELLAVSTLDAEVHLINPRTWQTERVIGAQASGITSLTFSPDGSRVVTGATDGTIRIWETSTGMECATLRGHEGYVTGLDFSADGTSLFSCSEDGTVRAWRSVASH